MQPSESNNPCIKYFSKSSLILGKCLSFFAYPPVNLVISTIFFINLALGNLLVFFTYVLLICTLPRIILEIKSTTSLSDLETDISVLFLVIAASANINPNEYAFSFESIFSNL